MPCYIVSVRRSFFEDCDLEIWADNRSEARRAALDLTTNAYALEWDDRQIVGDEVEDIREVHNNDIEEIEK